MPAVFIATLIEGEAVLRFPYDDRLRMLLRAIPGRRWDPESRVWRLPLDPDRAHALSALLDAVPYRVEVSEALDRALTRRRAKRSPEELLVDLARPDNNWWLFWVAFMVAAPYRRRVSWEKLASAGAISVVRGSSNWRELFIPGGRYDSVAILHGQDMNCS
ncbi:MAG: hypothetical protein ACLP4R_28480 [Solirubrobacteraceae bacterium]